MQTRTVLGLAMLVITMPGSALAEYVSLGAELNMNVNKWAQSPAIATDQNTPYVCWRENNDLNYLQIYVKVWNGAQWNAVGGSLNTYPNRDTAEPEIVMDGSTPYVVYRGDEMDNFGKVRVKYWNGSQWLQAGSSLNLLAGSNYVMSPDLAIEGTQRYVTWLQVQAVGRQVMVCRWNGADWTQVGNQLNFNANAVSADPAICLSNGTPYVTWCENDRVYVKAWNGLDWTMLGGGPANVNANRSALTPSGISAGTDGGLYATWAEMTEGYSVPQVRARYWNGAGWDTLGGSLNTNTGRSALYPDIALKAGTPYVTWSENNLVEAKYWNGSAWVPDGSNLNATTPAPQPHIACSADTAFVVWYEGPVSSDMKVHVKANGPGAYTPTATATSTPTPTASPSRTATRTNSATPLLSHTSTGTITVTWTATATRTHSPTQTATKSATPSLTPSPALSHTPTPTVTLSRTATRTNTATPQLSHTSTGTITVTWTATATRTHSPTQTATKSATPSLTASPALSRTSTTTASPSRTATRTPTASFASPSPSPTGGSPAASSTWTVTRTPGAGEDETIVIYPNPARGVVRFVLRRPGVARVKVEIFNATGDQLVLLGPEEGSAMAWDTTGTAAGIYLCLITTWSADGTQERSVRKIAVNP